MGLGPQNSTRKLTHLSELNFIDQLFKSVAWALINYNPHFLAYLPFPGLGYSFQNKLM